MLITYGTSGYVYVSLRARGTTNILASVPLATGDAMVSLDGGTYTNLTNLPVEIPSGTGQLRVQFTASETQAKIIGLKIIDQTTVKVFDDFYSTYETYGNVNAAYSDLGWSAATRSLSDNSITTTTFSSGFSFNATVTPSAITSIAEGVWTSPSRTLSASSFQAQIPATTLSALASTVWTFATRTLSASSIDSNTFNPNFAFSAVISPATVTAIASSVWINSTRTLSSGAITSSTFASSAINSSVLSPDINLNAILGATSISNVATSVWSYTNRSLTAPVSATVTGTVNAQIVGCNNNVFGPENFYDPIGVDIVNMSYTFIKDNFDSTFYTHVGSSVWINPIRSLTQPVTAYVPATVNANIVSCEDNVFGSTSFISAIDANVLSWGAGAQSSGFFDSSFYSGIWANPTRSLTMPVTSVVVQDKTNYQLAANQDVRNVLGNVTGAVSAIINPSNIWTTPATRSLTDKIGFSLLASEHTTITQDVTGAMNTFGYTRARGNKLDYLDASILSRQASGVISSNAPTTGDIAGAVWSYINRTLSASAITTNTFDPNFALSVEFDSSSVSALSSGVWNWSARALTTSIPTTGQIASAVWEEVLSGHVTTGTAGAKLNATTASSGGATPFEIWTYTGTRALTTPVTSIVVLDKIGYALTSAEHVSITNDATGGMNTLGYTAARATKLNYLDAPILSRQASGVTSSNAPTTGEIASSVWAYATRSVTLPVTSVVVQDKTSYQLAANQDIRNVLGNVTGAVSAIINTGNIWTSATRTLTDKTGFSLLASEHTTITQDVTGALNTFGYTSVRANKLDYLDASILSRQASGVVSTSAPTTGQIAAAVWEELLINHTSAGTAGAKLNSTTASSGGASPFDIWTYANRSLTAPTTALLSAGTHTGAIIPTVDTITNPVEINSNDDLLTILGYTASGAISNATWNSPARSLTVPVTSVIVQDKTNYQLAANQDIRNVLGNVTGSVSAIVNTGTIWANTTRTLTDYATGTIATSVWNNVSRTVTDKTGFSLLASEHTLITQDVSGAVVNLGYSQARAAKLDYLDARILSRQASGIVSSNAPTTGEIATAIWNNAVRTITDKTGFYLAAGEHGSIATDVTSGMSAQGYTTSRAANLDRLDVNVSTRLSSGGLVSLSSSERNLIASSIFGFSLETGWTAAETLRVISAVLAGECNITGTDPSYTVTFRDVNDTKNRLVASTDNIGRRLSIVSYDKS